MATQSKKVRMYEPWGYQEENNYQSDENILLGDLDSFFSEVEYNTDDKKIHFYNKEGEEKATLDVSGFSSSVVESTNYDSTTKILTITFSNGDVVEINLAELIDENEFGNGLEVNDGIVSVLIDAESDPYLTVGEGGIKLSGVDVAIASERERAISAETALQSAIEAESERATSAETTLHDLIGDIGDEIINKLDDEIARATSAETELQSAIEAESERATSAETALQSAIEAEVTRAQGEESRIDTKITNEITRATQTEQHLNARLDSVVTDLNAEKTIRQAADVQLDGKIDQETARATSAETDINNSIADLVEQLEPLINDTLITTNEHEVAFGQYNVSHTSEELADKTIVSVGYGSDDENRKNLFEVRANGDVYMWVEGDYVQINDLLGMLTHEVYDDDSGS